MSVRSALRVSARSVQLALKVLDLLKVSRLTSELRLKKLALKIILRFIFTIIR